MAGKSTSHKANIALREVSTQAALYVLERCRRLKAGREGGKQLCAANY